MNFDLRIPIGIMFSFYGLILSVFGLVTQDDPALYSRSLGIDINLKWGVVMLVFGLAMLFLSLGGSKKSGPPNP